jgi:hypothetical protein
VRRFRIFHAWFAQVPDGFAAEDLPSLVGDHAISRLKLDVPADTSDHLANLACLGLLWEQGLGPDDAFSFIQEDV